MSKFPENAQYRISEAFSKRLKHIMYDNDCSSNKQFAELAGVSVPVIAKAVNFGIIPSSRILVKIADKLDLSLSYLLGMADENEFIAANNPSTFDVRLAELVNEKDTNYGRLAEEMTFPRTYMYVWIRDKTIPTVDYLLELSDYFKVSLDYLLGRTDIKN